LGICRIRRVPVLLETLYEDLLYGLWPDLSAAAILEELAVLALWGDARDGWIVLRLHGVGGGHWRTQWRDGNDGERLYR